MIRVRWYQTEWPFPMNVLGKRLKSKPYNQNVYNGFIIDRLRDDYIEAKYIEKISYTEDIVDPFGNKIPFQRLFFQKWEFIASSGLLGLELVNAPRNNQSFISRLLEVSDFSLTINSINVNILEWCNSFQKKSKIKSSIDLIQIGDIELGDGIVAKTIIKGNNNVVSASKNMISGKKYKVEKLQLRLNDRIKGTILFTNSGSVKINTEIHDEIICDLRETIADAVI